MGYMDILVHGVDGWEKGNCMNALFLLWEVTESVEVVFCVASLSTFV